MNLAFLLLFVAWVCIILVSTFSAWRYGWGLPRPEIPSREPPVAVLVAVKGVSNETRQFFQNLLAQAYANFRLIVSVESVNDPAYGLALELAQASTIEMVLVVAGEARDCGQKVANLLAALDKLEPRDEIVVFTDADTLPDPRWISRLVAALVDAGHEAVTGYRWMVPIDNRLITALVAAANTSIATLPRTPYATNICWGGTMALRQKTLQAINIRSYWEGSVIDDLQMTRALSDHRIKLFSPRQNLLLSPVSFNFRSALAFGCRQYRFVFLYYPWLWVFAVFCLMTPVLACLACLWLTFQGDFRALALPGFAIICGEIRYQARKKIAGALWGAKESPGRVDRWLRPLWWVFHTLCLLAAPWSRKIYWAGKIYFVAGRQKLTILKP